MLPILIAITLQICSIELNTYTRWNYSRGVWIRWIPSRVCLRLINSLYHLPGFLCNAWGCMCLSSGDQEDIFITHHIFINRKYQSFPLLSYFFRCMPEVVIPLYALFHIYRGKPGFPFFYYCAVLWSAQVIKYIIGPWPLWPRQNSCHFAMAFPSKFFE